MKQLKVSPFEHYMLADDTSNHPMFLLHRWSFEGRIERSVFIDAVRSALVRHPLLSAKLRGNPGDATSTLSWNLEDRDEWLPEIIWEAKEPTYDSIRRNALNLQSEGGFRLHIEEVLDGTTLVTTVWVEMHHAISDGIGAIRFIEDVLVFYSGALEFQRPLNDKRLESRITFDDTAKARRQRRWKGIDRAFRFWRNRATPLAVPKNQGRNTGDSPFLNRSLSLSESQAIQESARIQEVTVNDLLLRDLFLTIDEWNLSHGVNRLIRIAVALSLRRGWGTNVPAANVVGVAFLDRNHKHCQKADHMLQTISEEMTEIIKHRLGIVICYVAEWFGKFKGGMRFLLSPKPGFACFITATFATVFGITNGWRLPTEDGSTKVGDLKLTNFTGFGPVRPQTATAFGVTKFGQRYSANLTFDPGQISRENAEKLLDQYVDRIRSYPQTSSD